LPDSVFLLIRYSSLIIVNILGQTTISNDGATILKQLDIVFPAAIVMSDIAKSQDAEVGDGTTSGLFS